MLARRSCLPAAVACGVTLCAGLLVSAQQPVSSPPAATEELIAEKGAATPADDKEDTVSLDGRKVAWRTEQNNKWSVMLNGQRQAGEFDEVRWLTFSRDSQHLAFAARSGKTWLMVLDGKEPAQRFEEVERPVFSRDGTRLAYAAKRDKKWYLIVNDELSPAAYEGVGLPLFSRDGRRVACAVKRAGKWVMVVDGQEQGLQFDDIEDRMFSPDAQRLAYVGRRGSKWMVVLDGKEGPPFDIAGGLTFSSDSRRFGHIGTDLHTGWGGDSGRSRMVIDGELSPEFEGRGIGKRFSLSGMASEYFSYLLYRFVGVTPPLFSPDGSRVVYAARRGKDNEVVIVDGKPGPQVASIIGVPVFSEDSRHVAYAVSEGDVRTLVIDGERVSSGCAPGTDVVDEITFGPDNRRMGYVGVIGGKFFESGASQRARRRLYVDGQGGTEYDALGTSGPWFSADSRHAAYVVHGLEETSRHVSFVVTDSIEGKRYDHVFAGTLEVVNSSTVVYTAQAGRKFVRVTQMIQ